MRMPKLNVIHEYTELGVDAPAAVSVDAMPSDDAPPPVQMVPTDPKAPRSPIKKPGDDEEPFANVVDFLCVKGVSRAMILDAVSALLSMIALVLALWRLSVRGVDWYARPLSMQNTLMAPNGTDVGSAMENALSVDLTGVCKSLPGIGIVEWLFGIWFLLLPLGSETPYTQSITSVVYEKVSYRGTTLAMQAGLWNPMLALVWIFSVSVFFQTWRVVLFSARGNIARNNNGLVCGLFSEYRPYAGPDFFKWVEYALTSPLQIVIIAGTFNIRDRSMLLLLGTLQGALVLLGDSIELRLRKLVKHCRKRVTGPDASRKRSHTLKIVYMLSSAWAVHSIIWYVLLERFSRQTDNLSDCGYESEMPFFVNFIVFGEFLLFTLFGIIPVVQTVLVLTTDFSSEQKKKDPAHWSGSAQAYAVLSVSAKTLLEFGFLMLIETTPNMRDE